MKCATLLIKSDPTRPIIPSRKQRRNGKKKVDLLELVDESPDLIFLLSFFCDTFHSVHGFKEVKERINERNRENGMGRNFSK
jgi:hypothetical protein